MNKITRVFFRKEKLKLKQGQQICLKIMFVSFLSFVSIWRGQVLSFKNVVIYLYLYLLLIFTEKVFCKEF